MKKLESISSYLPTFFFALLLMSLLQSQLHAYDILLEFKGAYFLPTDSLFKDIYHNGSAAYGPEITAQLYEGFYGFASVDFFNKKGHSLGLCSPTKVSIINFSLGLKYLIPFGYGDVYVGLGAVPTRVHIENCSPYVTPCQTQWTCGGIAKIGAYFDLPRSFILDLFFDYSFITLHPQDCLRKVPQVHSACLNGCWFGSGIGYRFN